MMEYVIGFIAGCVVVSAFAMLEDLLRPTSLAGLFGAASSVALATLGIAVYAPSPFKEVATIRDKPIHPSDSIIAIGYPYHGLLTSDFTVTTGIVSSLSGLLNDTRYLQISAAVQPSNSGGPLLDSSGEVVGMVAAKLNALKFAKYQFRHQDGHSERFP
jgi:hypothetical protein